MASRQVAPDGVVINNLLPGIHDTDRATALDAGVSAAQGISADEARARRESVLALFDYLEGELDAVGHYPADKRPVMTCNMRDMFHRMDMTEQDVRTVRGALRALTRPR